MSPRTMAGESQKTDDPMLLLERTADSLNTGPLIKGGSGERTAVLRAGRTTIGLSVPGSTNQPSFARTAAATAMAQISKVAALIDTRLVELLLEGPLLEATRWEFALLVSLRRNLQPPSETSLGTLFCESLEQFAEDAQEITLDLMAGGTKKLRRLYDYNRQLLSELTALGMPQAPLRLQLASFRERLDASAGENTENLSVLGQEGYALFSKITQELNARFPSVHTGLINLILRP